jgi:hypothetical protein
MTSPPIGHASGVVSCGPSVSTAVPRPKGKVQIGEINFSLTRTFVEPPIGIEPMTYALRVRRSSRLS